jgi:hypothetical protein
MRWRSERSMILAQIPGNIYRKRLCWRRRSNILFGTDVGARCNMALPEFSSSDSLSAKFPQFWVTIWKLLYFAAGLLVEQIIGVAAVNQSVPQPRKSVSHTFTSPYNESLRRV